MRPGEEAPPDFAAHAQWEERDGRRHFRQPCHAFDGCCTRYHLARPHICGAYRCMLLRACEAGTVGWEEATGRVATAQRLRRQVTALLDAVLGPPPAPEGLAHRMNAFLATQPPAEPDAAFRRRHARLFLQYGALRDYLSRHFHALSPPEAAPAPMQAAPAASEEEGQGDAERR